jgi:hypothetical protein
MTEDALILRVPGQGRLAGLALVSAALQPVGGRPLARPAVGSRGRRRRAPDPLALPCLRRFLAAVLRIVRARSGPSSPCRSSRGLRPGKVFSGAPASLISSEDFPGLALTGRRDSTGTAPQASPAAKKQRGEREAGRSP